MQPLAGLLYHRCYYCYMLQKQAPWILGTRHTNTTTTSGKATPVTAIVTTATTASVVTTTTTIRLQMSYY